MVFVPHSPGVMPVAAGGALADTKTRAANTLHCALGQDKI